MFGIKFTTCKCHDYEKPVVSGLAVTPSDMARLTAQGRVVASSSLDSFKYNDGVHNPEDLPIQFHRGVDINTAWETSERIKNKIKAFKKKKQLDKKFEEISNPEYAPLN